MNTTVVKFDTLADTVRTSSENHNLLIVAAWTFIFNMVAGVIISRIFGAAYMNAFPAFHDSCRCSGIANSLFRNFQNFTQIFIRKAIKLSLTEYFCRRYLSLILQQCFFLFHQLLHLFDKVVLNLGKLKEFVYRCAFSQSFIHNELTLAGRYMEHGQEFFFRFLVKILHMAESVAASLQASDCFLECLFIGLSDTHNLAYGFHLSSQFILRAFEFLKCPACKFNYNIIAGRNVFIQSAAFTARNLIQSKPCCQHGRYEGNREACCLGCQSRGTGGSWINLDYDVSVSLRIMCPLHVCTADYFNRLNNFV